MSTSPVQEGTRMPPPLAPVKAAAVRVSPREEALSGRIRRTTVRRRLLQVTDALALADLLLGMNRSLNSMGEDQA